MSLQPKQGVAVLNPEQARKELEKFKRTDWVQTRIAGLGRLPERLLPTARAMLGVDEKGAKLDHLQHHQERAKQFDIVPTLSTSERVQLFESLLPGLGRSVEEAWLRHERFPYQTGPTRKPFRTPGRNEALDERRVVWLTRLLEAIGPFPQPLPWLAAWAGHLSSYASADAVGILLAAAIDQGGAEGNAVFDVLCASSRGEHEIGSMGRHVTRGLLCASRPDGWEAMEKLLLAAQREEGLRQVILETVDEAHPEAFRRMLRLIKDHDLARFSATVRAANTWFGFGWDAVSAGVVNSELGRALKFLEDSATRNLGVFDADAETAYLALWATAFDDAIAALAPAAELLKHREPAHRFAAVHFLDQLGLVTSQEKLLPAIGDADSRVAVRAMLAILNGAERNFQTAELFNALERLHTRLPERETKFEPLVWPWCAYTLDRRVVHCALAANSNGVPPTRLLPYLDAMDSNARYRVARGLSGTAWRDPEAKKALLTLAGDASPDVREMALRGLERRGIEPDEAPQLEKLLTRSASGVRRGVLTLLLKQDDAGALASAERLLAPGAVQQRRSGLELLRQMVEGTRSVEACRSRAAAYREENPARDEFEEAQLAGIDAGAVEKPTLEDGLGLLDESKLTQAHRPPDHPILLHSPTTCRIVAALDDLLWENRERVVEYRDHDGQLKTELLANLRLAWPDEKLSPQEDRERFALAGLCEGWWLNRSPQLRDEDGFELLRITAYLGATLVWSLREPTIDAGLQSTAVLHVFGTAQPQQVRNQGLLGDVVRWLLRLHSPQGRGAFIIAAFETCLARLGDELHDRALAPWRSLAEGFATTNDSLPADYAPRLWNCHLWLHQLGLRRKLYLDIHWGPLQRAYLANAATDADVVYHLLAKRDARTGQAIGNFGMIGQATHWLRKPALSERQSELNRIIRRIADRIVEIELRRGEAPTLISTAALQVFHHSGVARLVAVVAALGADKFSRTYDSSEPSRSSVFSHLIFRCRPADGDTPEDFAAQARAARIPEKRIVELAVYAPQWARFAEHALGWPGLTEAARWIHAHTKTGEWSWRDESKEFWHASLSEHTALTADDLVDGAVDVAWFRSVHGALGGERWEKLYDAAKYACTGAGHTRARLFADAMLGVASREELAGRIRDKGHQDSVRALGLVPLPDAGRVAEVLERYQVIQEFMRASKEFGAQRRASEKRAAEIGLENLARTAGYADPLRLQWAMEARAIEDLAEGPVSVTVEGVTVSLGIDPWGEVELGVTKDGKRLADVPAKLKKQPDMARLRERKVELKRQAARIRPSLEQLMVRGDTFFGAELRELMKHPFLRPMLSNLVLVGEGVMGYPAHEGQALVDCAGGIEALKAEEKLRIAHPLDLLPAARWHEWQKDCFAKERIQPFKQVFREFYPLTEAEKQEGAQSRRYAGHQVQPRQALALLGQRGWVHHPEEGVRKTYHDVGLTAWLEFAETFYTPAEIEGLTLESVSFTKRGERGVAGTVNLTDVPPRLLSETMRDLDLVVSVAHSGGVDPEASASTIEMRSALVEESCRLLKLDNVAVKDRYALVKGDLGDYTIHLGSAVTRKMPGETLFIVPVHSQHRGRLFLPFADDDPRTAEVMSKVLLLARDKAIKDPSILDQIRRR